jgi:hypothetical protein
VTRLLDYLTSLVHISWPSWLDGNEERDAAEQRAAGLT